MTNEEWIDYIRKYIDIIDRIKYHNVLICHPDMAEFFGDRSDVLGALIFSNACMPKDKIYLIDREEYESWSKPESWIRPLEVSDNG